MKKILSLTLAAMMVASAIPTAFAADIPEVGKTTVTLVGTEEAAGAYYEVTVPAAMAPGDNADVTVEGNWNSAQTLKVTAPEKVTLYNGSQSIDVAITFAGINAAGNDLADCSATANLKLADASVKFGTWTGVIEYNVELVNGTVTPTPDPDTGDGEEGELITFKIVAQTYTAEKGMTFGEWLESDYSKGNTVKVIEKDGYICYGSDEMYISNPHTPGHDKVSVNDVIEANIDNIQYNVYYGCLDMNDDGKCDTCGEEI